MRKDLHDEFRIARFSRLAAASDSSFWMLGSGCEYKSRVMLTLEWPRGSETSVDSCYQSNSSQSVAKPVERQVKQVVPVR